MIQIILEYLIVSIVCFFFTLISIYRAPTDIELWGKRNRLNLPVRTTQFINTPNSFTCNFGGNFT